MPALRSALLAATLILAATAVPAVAPGAATASPAAPGSGTAGCVTTFEPPSTWIVVCGNGGGSGGGGGGGGGGGKVVCTLQPLSPGNITFFGLPPAPPGEEWAAITCPGNSPFGGVTLVDTAGAPAVTPQELLQEVEGQLTVTPLPAQTAPPQPRDGLVGLPEWFWIPRAEWRPVRTQRLQVGPVWAQVTATPQKIMFVAGGGQGQAVCFGPGTPFSAAAPNATSACSYTYQQSSATQQGGAYAASVTVVWKVTWAGFSPATGPVGGVLNAALPIADPFNLKVAEGQALVSGTGVSQ